MKALAGSSPVPTASEVKNLSLKTMDQKGFSKITVVVLALATITSVGGYLVLVNKQSEAPRVVPTGKTPFPKQGVSPAPEAVSDAFDEERIIKSVGFTSSIGDPKRLIIVRTNEGVFTTDVYISDPDLSRETAIKIPALSGDKTSLAFAGDRALVSVSPGPGKKFILISYQIGDSYPTFILDESGNLISADVVSNAYAPVIDECLCGFGFEDWKDQDEFYVEVRTSKGGTYRMLMDAKTGEMVGPPQEKK